MSKIIARPQNINEPDLLSGHENEALVITDLNDNVMMRIVSNSSWTFDLLEKMEHVACSVAEAHGHNTWNAYLGIAWIGSSEV